MKSKIYLAITIDTECDKGEKWIVKQPFSFHNIYNGVESQLQPIFDKYNVKATYLLSPEIIRDQKSVEIFKKFNSRVELGTHLHSEFIGPEADFSSKTTKEFQSNFKPEIEKAKLKNLTTLFKDTFGYQPLSFRAGRFGISEFSLKFLQDLGYLVDSSVTPDSTIKHKESNKVINFFGSPYQPYFPSLKDFRKKGKMKILQVPVTVMHKKLLSLPLWLKRGFVVDKSYQHIIFNYLTKFSKQTWLRPTYADFDEMKNITDDMILKAKGKDVFLCMMFHSNEFEVGMSPYSLTEDNVTKILDRLDTYLNWLTKKDDFHSLGLSEIKTKF
ncbi:hypothetical protein H8K90_02165 [Winogradskyella echinorum]|uniref:Polysaccharide deacetylase n=1 Tax=Winogradskyella echinorum TaxID=538189 RepID=A0ABR6XXH5_9FLAO|nr:hypothetical protein [Winogradskyella echinorum]MBC3845173.1 hypothetical protein [Winogradskyella echinorum]MBC5749521.1 hypothetical protein [Winogradskyella echinorum]